MCAPVLGGKRLGEQETRFAASALAAQLGSLGYFYGKTTVAGGGGAALSYIHTHTYARTHTHTRTHTRTHTHAHTYTHIHAHLRGVVKERWPYTHTHKQI